MYFKWLALVLLILPVAHGATPLGVLRSVSPAVGAEKFAFGAGVVVGVSPGHRLFSGTNTSNGGVTYGLIPDPVGSFMDVAYGGGTFVALAKSHSSLLLLTSPDGTNWSSQTTGLTATTNSQVASGNGAFFVSNGSAALHSTDASHWTDVALPLEPTGTSATSIEFLAGKFWLGASDGRLWSSIDAREWSPASPFTTDAIAAIAFERGAYLVVTRTGESYGSENGVDWEFRSKAPFTFLGLQSANGMFAANLQSDVEGGRVAISPSGHEWSLVPHPAQHIARVESGFMARSWTPNYMGYSPSGLVWKWAGFGPVAQIRTGEESLLRLNSNRWEFSHDARHWTQTSAPSEVVPLLSDSASLRETLFQARGDGIYRATGAGWEKVHPKGASFLVSSPDQILAVTGGEHHFGSRQIFRSIDGTNWTEHPFPTNARVSQLAYLGGRFVISGSSGTIFPLFILSGDGLAWHGFGMPDYRGGGSMAFYGDRYYLNLSDQFETELQPPVHEIHFQAREHLPEIGETWPILVRRTGAINAPLTITLKAEGSASMQQDYTLSTNTIFFGPGETSKAISLTILHDALAETSESIVLSAAYENPGGFRSASAVINIHETGANPWIDPGSLTPTPTSVQFDVFNSQPGRFQVESSPDLHTWTFVKEVELAVTRTPIAAPYPGAPSRIFYRLRGM